MSEKTLYKRQLAQETFDRFCWSKSIDKNDILKKLYRAGFARMEAARAVEWIEKQVKKAYTEG